LTDNELLEKSLGSPACIISVMGDHAREGENTIFQRKMEDIAKIRRTFWLHRSYKARPDSVAKMMKADGAGHVLFIAPAAPGGARPTMIGDRATEFSPDRERWIALPEHFVDRERHILLRFKGNDPLDLFLFDRGQFHETRED
jgi:hypothetical protein